MSEPFPDRQHYPAGWREEAGHCAPDGMSSASLHGEAGVDDNGEVVSLLDPYGKPKTAAEMKPKTLKALGWTRSRP